ncbi:MAG TPA: cobalt-precorrin-5B (C(1))-methyltransferase CbiD [Leptolyngbyaceae cyanobacterium]
MVFSQPRFGYTLPVFACASALAALQWLKQRQPIASVSVNLIEPNQIVEIAIEQVAGLKENEALAITRSDPGDNLDLTRHTPIWAMVELTGNDLSSSESILLEGGEGIGRHAEGGKAAIYSYAQTLFRANLEPLLAPGEKIRVKIILPEGRQLAQRTSNAAFGIVEGLSLLGTTGISQPLSAPGQLDAALRELREKVNQSGREEEVVDRKFPPFPHPLIFCVGENGLDLARQMGISSNLLLKTANWLGPMLVEAALQGVKRILLFGYHGKLIKVAGGIFHTHHHLADGRLEILTAQCVKVGLPIAELQNIFASSTAEAALQYLRDLDGKSGSNWVNLVYSALAQTIDNRSQAYIRTFTEREVEVGSLLFDGKRQIIVKSKQGEALLSQLS